MALVTAIRDQDGRLLGYFTPLSEEERERYRQARAAFDPKVIAQRKQYTGPWLTTQEVLDHLKSLETGECDSQ